VRLWSEAARTDTPLVPPYPSFRKAVRVMTPAAPASSRRASSEEILALWHEYRRTDDRAVRDRLVLTFAPLVKYIVYKKVREMPARCEVEDFISCGLEALIGSIERFDPSKGATLEQYAWTRIHGAVLDELRRQDWAPRSVRRWERDMDRVSESFSALHGRKPTVDELADALGVEPAEVRRRRGEITRSDLTSLNTLVMSDDETTIERIDTLAATDERLDPLHAAAASEAKQKFRDAFAQLPEREREIAVLLYVKNLTLAEIGEVLGVSESRVCQIHGEMKKKLRKTLEADAQILQLVA
jgi:RNA polymerase sigma factor FliA